jgi:hypothetical protein
VHINYDLCTGGSATHCSAKRAQPLTAPPKGPASTPQLLPKGSATLCCVPPKSSSFLPTALIYHAYYKKARLLCWMLQPTKDYPPLKRSSACRAGSGGICVLGTNQIAIACCWHVKVVRDGVLQMHCMLPPDSLTTGPMICCCCVHSCWQGVMLHVMYTYLFLECVVYQFDQQASLKTSM